MYVVRTIERIHCLDELGQRVRHDEMIALFLHLPHETMIAEQRLLEKRQQPAVANMWIVLGAGDGELFRGNAPVQQLPAPRLLECRQPSAHLVRIESGHERMRPDALTRVIEPQRRLAGNQAQPVPVEMRIRMRDAGRVIPHVTEMGNDAAMPFNHVVEVSVTERVRSV
jgi:hypothetical protein